MTRFYFHMHSDRGVSRDTYGIEFADLDAAYLDAFRAATDLWRELLRARKDPRTYRFEIADASGRTLLELPFAEILQQSHKAKPAPISRIIESAHGTRELNAGLADAIASQIRTAREHLAESRELLRRYP